MNDSFRDMLMAGGHKNSLGRTNEVIDLVLGDSSRLSELYRCLSDDDAWVRMRAVDTLEKICRVHPDWILPYVNRMLTELTTSDQPSIQWHLAQIFGQVKLSSDQKQAAIKWLKTLLADSAIDWIVAANAMDTLYQFTADGAFPEQDMAKLLYIQRRHKSMAVVRRADKLLAALQR